MSRTTQLDAINEVLSLVGMSTVVSLDDPTRQDTIAAEQTLQEVLKHIGTQNSYYNTVVDVEFFTDSEGFIYVTDDVYDVEYLNSTQQVVLKGDRIYNLTKKTFVWDAASVDFQVTYFLTFTDLPEVVKRYVISATASRLYLKLFGASTQLNYLIGEEKLTYDIMQRWEFDAMDANVLAHPEVVRIWGSPRRGGNRNRR